MGTTLKRLRQHGGHRSRHEPRKAGRTRPSRVTRKAILPRSGIRLPSRMPPHTTGGRSSTTRNSLGKGKYAERGLGQDPDGVSIHSFRQAQDAARAWWRIGERKAHGMAPKIGPFTVAMALEAYFAERERRGSKGLAQDRAATSRRGSAGFAPRLRRGAAAGAPGSALGENRAERRARRQGLSRRAGPGGAKSMASSVPRNCRSFRSPMPGRSAKGKSLSPMAAGSSMSQALAPMWRRPARAPMRQSM